MEVPGAFAQSESNGEGDGVEDAHTAPAHLNASAPSISPPPSQKVPVACSLSAP
jgi:hypothetical protein